MEKLSICRVCLATGVRLCSIASHLRDMFERISSMTFNREDGRPLVTCYICHARLQNCYRLRTSCIQSEELLTELMSSGELKPQDMLSTNTFRVVTALHLSLGHVKDAASEDISDADLLYNEGIVTEAQEEQHALIEDKGHSSHLEDPIDIIKKEADNVETDAEYINLEEGDINQEEIGWKPKPDIAGPSLQLADNNSRRKIVMVVLKRINLNDSRVGAPVSKKSTIAALKDTEDATSTTKKRKMKVIKQTETISFKEPKIVTKKIEVYIPVTTSKTLETCGKVDINLNKYNNVVTSIVNDVCEEKKNTNNTSLERNISSVSSRENKPFSCDTCNKCFSYKHNLNVHIRTHSGDKPYQCNICKKYFTQKSQLHTHIRTHSNEKPYQCNICKKYFTQKSNLSAHIRTHSDEKLNQCNICNKCYNHKGHLKSHFITHTGDKPYQCNDCNKRYYYKQNLKVHICMTHLGEKPYQCNICKKCFPLKNSLQAHILTHSGEKPYQCNFCGKCFTQRGSLQTHILIHTGEKPHQCNICKKCFTQKSYLKSHILIHTGEKPHQCNVCNKCFMFKHHLKTHIRKHTGEKPYQCNVCKMCFSDSSSCSRHMGIHKR